MPEVVGGRGRAIKKKGGGRRRRNPVFLLSAEVDVFPAGDPACRSRA